MINEILHITLNLSFNIQLLVKVKLLLTNTSDNSSNIWPNISFFLIHLEEFDGLKDL